MEIGRIGKSGLGALFLVLVLVALVRGACDTGVDADSDGDNECVDRCDYDPEKIEAGVCGCGVADVDLDEDNVMDCLEQSCCRDDPLFQCGCSSCERFNYCWLRQPIYEWVESPGWVVFDTTEDGEILEYTWRDDGHYSPNYGYTHMWHENTCSPNCHSCSKYSERISCEDPTNRGNCRWCALESKCALPEEICLGCETLNEAECGEQDSCAWCLASESCIFSESEGSGLAGCECSLFTGRQDDCESDLNPGCEYCADSGVCTLVADAIPCEVVPQPIANGDAAQVNQGESVEVDILINDSVSEATSEDLVVLRLDASGITDSVYFNGTVVIYRSFNAPGVFAVPYLLSLTGANQPIVFGELEVTVVNQPPVAAADRYTVAPHSVNPTTQLNVLENDSDPGLDDLQIRLCNSGGVGQCAISSDNQTLLYTTPSDSQVGDVINISYEVEDPFGGISSANVRILVDFAGLRIVDTSPINGEEGVALTRETVFTFSHPINIAVNLFDVFEVTFAGQSYPFRAHLSADRYRITLFYTNTLPPSATMRVRVNGVLLLDDNAEPLFNTEYILRFSTLTTLPVSGTSVVGHVYASELEDGERRPLVGAVITVDTREEEMIAVTDVNGRFVLEPCPAGRFFAHVDGRSLSHPDIPGSYYPFVGKPWYAHPQRQTDIGDVYLPVVHPFTLQPVSDVAETEIGFPDSIVAQNPNVYSSVKIMVPPNSLMSNDGTFGGRVGIAPVNPERLPGELPAMFDPSIVITVQTDGPSNFDVPVPVCFPNLDSPDGSRKALKAGEKSSLWSFSHDAGRFEMVGSATVSDNALTVCTDPGVGVRAPGWHMTIPVIAAALKEAFNCLTSDVSLKKRGMTYVPDYPFTNPEDVDPSFCRTKECIHRHLERDIGACTCAVLKTVGRAAFDAADCALSVATGSGVADFYNCGKSSLKVGLSVYEASSPDTPGYDECALSSAASIGFQGGKAVADCAKLLLDGACSASPTSKFCAAAGCAVTGGVNLLDNACNAAETCSGSEYGACDVTGGLKKYQPEIKGGLDIACNVQSCGGKFNEFVKSTNAVSVAVDYLEARTGNNANSCVEDLKERQQQQKVYDDYRQYFEENRGSVEAVTQSSKLTDDYFNTINSVDDAIADALSSQLRQVAETGPQEGEVNSARVVESPFYFTFQDLDTGNKFQGQASAAGVVSNIALPPNTPYVLQVFDPATNELGRRIGTTPEAGSNLITNPVTFIPQTDMNDADGDGLSDEAEFAIGTNPNSSDSDNDGTPDFSELQAGTNPLDGIPVEPGIDAVIQTVAAPSDLCVGNEVVSAALGTDCSGSMWYCSHQCYDTGSEGIAFFSVLFGNAPSVAAQISMDDHVFTAVGCGAGYTIANRGDNIAVVFDVRIPSEAAAIGEVEIECDEVTSLVGRGELAFVGCKDGTLAIIDLPSRGIIHENNKFFAPVNDLDVSGDLQYLFAMTTDTIWRIPILRAIAFITDSQAISISIPGADETGRLHVGNDYVTAMWDQADAIVIEIDGFSIRGNTGGIYDSIGATSVTQADANTMIVSRRRQSSIDVWNINDPNNPSIIRSIDASELFDCELGVFNGRIFASCSDNPGIYVVRFISPDFALQGPILSMNAPASAEQGAVVSVEATAVDDVLVSQVQFLVDGEVVETDATFPFSFSFPLVSATQADSVTVSAVSVDTAGNRASSQTVIQITAPSATPSFLISQPTDAQYAFDIAAVFILFDRPVDPTTLESDDFTFTNLGPDGAIGGGDDSLVDIEVRDVGFSTIALQIRNENVLPTGVYHVTVNLAEISDYNGAPSVGSLDITFTHYAAMPRASLVWDTDIGGDWDTASKWQHNRVPQNTDSVIIARFGADPVVIFDGEHVTLYKVLIWDPLVADGGRFSVSKWGNILDLTATDGTIEAEGGHLEIFFTSAINANIRAEQGGELVFSATGNALGQSTELLADGAGSVLRSSTLTSINSPSLPCKLNADDEGLLDLPAFGPSITCSVLADHGGRIRLPSVSSIGCLPTSTDTTWTITRPGSAIELNSAIDISCLNGGLEFWATFGGSFIIPSVATATGAVEMFSVFSSGIPSYLAFPELISFDNSGGIRDQTETLNWLAADGGTLDLPKLIAFPTDPDCTSGSSPLTVEAEEESTINVPLATHNQDGCCMRLISTGTNSIVNATSFVSLVVDVATTSPSAIVQESDGHLQLGILNSIEGVVEIENGESSRPFVFDQITSLPGGVTVIATNGASVSFPNVLTVDAETKDCLIRAEDANSFVSFPQVTGSLGCSLYAENGLVSFPLVTELRARRSGMRITHKGAEEGAGLNLPLVSTIRGFDDIEIEVYADDGAIMLWSNLLTSLHGVELFSEESAVLSMPEVTIISLDVATQAEDYTIRARTGGQILLPNVIQLIAPETIYETDIFALTGGYIDLSSWTSINELASVEIHADDANSVIDISSLTNFTLSKSVKSNLIQEDGGSIIFGDLTTVDAYIEFENDNGLDNWVFESVTALLGGVSVTARDGSSITFPNVITYDGTTKLCKLFATDLQSVISFPSLPTLSCHIDAYEGGRISLPLLTRLEALVFDVDFEVQDALSSVDVPSLDKMVALDKDTQIRVFAKGNELDLSSVTNVTGIVSFTAESAGIVDLSALTEFSVLDDLSTHSDVLATGAGSQVIISILSRLPSSEDQAFQFKVEALNGGFVNLMSVTDMREGESGRFHVRADGIGSSINLSNLQRVATTVSGGTRSRLIQEDNGQLILSSLTTIEGRVSIRNDMTSSALSVPGVTAWIGGGSVEASGAVVSMPNLASVTDPSGDTCLFLAELGGTLELPMLSGTINCDISALSGSTVNLPLVAKYEANRNDNHIQVRDENSDLVISSLAEISAPSVDVDVEFTVREVDYTFPPSLKTLTGLVLFDVDDGNLFANSVTTHTFGVDKPQSLIWDVRQGSLIMNNLATLNGNLHDNANLIIEASSGGTFVLGISTITGGRVQFDARETGATINVPNLTTIDSFLRVRLSSSGSILMPGLSTISSSGELVIEKTSSSTLDLASLGPLNVAGELDVNDDLVLETSVTVSGRLIVDAVTLVLDGYTQTASGVLEFDFPSLLSCSGAMILDGEFTSLDPPTNSVVFLEYSSVNGQFATLTNTGAGGIDVSYSATSATIIET